ncbi:unnamed protein product [Linum tenue]|uniref:U-box domain-containing protein n=1 Tax=Linum tenue TaxID=586396 RepID=A0AAV0NS27_9ROSI|nr:unnamed protein product [Linum tenue]
MGLEQASSTLKECLKDQEEGAVTTDSEILVKIAESLSLRTNQEILLEAVALEKLKEIADQAEKDPVIVASGQNYERTFIKNWIELGLTMCPKTRHTLAHTDLIPNYTMKALIANLCELNNVKLLVPVKFVQPSPAEPPRSVSSSGPILVPSSGFLRDGSSPLHSRSTSESSLSGIVANGQGIDIARISLTGFEESSAHSEERLIDSIASPSRMEEVSESVVAANEFPLSKRSHGRSASAANASFPRRSYGDDASESLDVPNHLITLYNSDTSGEVKVEMPKAVSSTATSNSSLHRESQFSPRFVETRSRSQLLL